MKLDLPLKPLPPSFQMYGHNRSPSREFKELTKRDAQMSLTSELDKLRITGNLSEVQSRIVDQEFDGFKGLFAKFLASEAAEGVVWDKIEKLPADAVSVPIPDPWMTEIFADSDLASLTPFASSCRSDPTALSSSPPRTRSSRCSRNSSLSSSTEVSEPPWAARAPSR